jgi:N-ethylmaleimide reductase
VHAKGGKIVVQLMHTGRVSNDINLGPGGETIGPSAEICPGDMFTDSKGLQPNSAPRPMNEHDIQTAVDEYGAAASYALEAGFDGIELHAANGYLIEQFLNPHVNLRNDEYGVDITGRNRFALRVVNAAVKAIGAQRVSIRLSPYGVFNGTGAYPEVDEQYLALIKELSHSRLMYVHVLDHSAMGAPVVPAEIKLKLRQAFDGPFILTGGFDAASAETTLDVNLADLIGFGRPFVANPDLVRRMQIHAALNPPDMATFYTPGPKGYTDYPTLAE